MSATEKYNKLIEGPQLSFGKANVQVWCPWWTTVEILISVGDFTLAGGAHSDTKLQMNVDEVNALIGRLEIARDAYLESLGLHHLVKGYKNEANCSNVEGQGG